MKLQQRIFQVHRIHCSVACVFGHFLLSAHRFLGTDGIVKVYFAYSIVAQKTGAYFAWLCCGQKQGAFLTIGKNHLALARRF